MNYLGRCSWCGRKDGRKDCADCGEISCGRTPCERRHADYAAASPGR